VSLENSDKSLRVMRRRLKDAEVYLMFNEGSEAFSQRVVLHGKGKRVERWDAATGKVAEMKAGGRSVELSLKPYEACVLVVR
jgi:hypothetical protein